MAKRPKPARGKAFGILNPYGDLWTYNHFENEPDALAYLRRFAAQFKEPWDLSKFKVVPVKVTVSALSMTPPTASQVPGSVNKSAPTLSGEGEP